jgi:hypothetical protein
MDEVLAHPFFSGLDFHTLLSKQLMSPLLVLKKERETEMLRDIEEEERKSEDSAEDDEGSSVHESVIPDEIEEIIRSNQDKFTKILAAH